MEAPRERGRPRDFEDLRSREYQGKCSLSANATLPRARGRFIPLRGPCTRVRKPRIRGGFHEHDPAETRREIGHLRERARDVSCRRARGASRATVSNMAGG